MQIKVLFKDISISKRLRGNVIKVLRDVIDKSVTIDYDIILVEGYKLAEFDKIIVYRNEKI